MPRRRIPSYRHYKPKNLGMVVIDGRPRYLGRYGTDESRERYHRVIAEHLASPTPGSTVPGPLGNDLAPSLNELMLSYWERHVVDYYVKSGRPTSEQDNVRQALRFARRLYGHSPAKDFGPSALKAVRQAMIEAGRCRSLINKDVNRIRAMFRWAVEHELVPVSVHQALQAVAGLRKGRSEAREAEPVGPVPEAHIRAVLPHLSPQVAAMVLLQRLTGARPGEITSLRPRDIVHAEGGVWLYRPEEHKTEHFQRGRVIALGPLAQKVLLPWLDRDPSTYCFSPAEVVAARTSGQGGAVESASAISKRIAGRPAARPKPGGRSTKDSYRVAIRRACRRAGVPVWVPNQLRHTRATEIRERYGLEAAQVVLGHSKASPTEIYAERDMAKARAIMAEIG
jgi:integrase